VNIHVAHISRMPLTHLSSFLKKDGGTKNQKSMVPDLATQPKAVKLVVSKIGSICSEYDDLLGSEWKTLWASLLELLVGEHEAAIVKIKQDIVMHVVEGRCALQLRFVDVLMHFPWRLAFMVTAPPTAKSESRRLNGKSHKRVSNMCKLCPFRPPKVQTHSVPLFPFPRVYLRLPRVPHFV
jgi:hypothetical protein